MGVIITDDMIKGAQATETLYGIPASITLGQIMLESGGDYEGGLSGLAYNYNNLFGITQGSGWKGEVVYLTNKDGLDGQYYRVYESQSESIKDHGKVLNQARYTKHTKNAKNVKEFAQAIKDGGYATDPDYASKLFNVIVNNNLTQYDGEWKGKTGNNNQPTDTVNGNSIGAESDSESGEGNELKWWGDLIVVILSVLLIALAVVFFVLAFNGGSVKNVVKSATNIATHGAIDKLEKLGN